MGFFGKLKGALKKTTDLLRTDVRDLFKAGEILDEPKLQEFEKRLLLSDMGFVAAQEIVTEVREKHGGRTVDVEAIWSTVKAKLRSLLKGDEDVRYDSDNPVSPLNLQSDGPTVILVSGVNGVGKTTSIAKLANLIQKSGKSVLLAAGDTFRAAAVEQLTMWSERLGCEIVTKPAGTDPASVAYTGCDVGVAKGVDVIIIDTAGRLQTHQNLMDELHKIYRVIAKRIPEAPHEALLVLDATTGQNGLSQAKHFSEVVECSGLVLAKLDGSAKGGVAIAIRQTMGIPVKYVGLGEQIDDLEVFDPDNFVDALIDKEA
ncbi:MAG: signal recognition particle-docking protein FtsY [Planctomycetaceae bacterium]|nr:signal recognition particle-docking protein FtsY [Planctomycetaceae bacterium]